MVSAGQNIFTNGLNRGLAMIPGVNAPEVIAAGATEL